MCQVVFEVLKLSPEHYSNKSLEDQQSFITQTNSGKTVDDVRYIFTKLDLLWLARITGTGEKHGREFFLLTGTTPNMPITYDDFKKSYPKVKSMHLFTWINNLISGF